MNPLFIFLNVYQNSGHIINWLLQKQFKNSFFVFEANDPGASLLGSDLNIFISENQNIKAISSSGLRMPLVNNSIHSLITGLFLRHPLERIFGIYESDRRRFGISLDDKDYFSLRNYIESKISKNFNSFRDAQVNFIGDGGTYYEAPKLEGFLRAKNNLQQLNFCGLVHMFYESIVVLEHELHPYFDDLDLAYFPKGVTIGEFVSLESRLDLLKNEIGNEYFDFLLNNNRYDLELIQIAEVNLIQRLHSIPNWQEKLIDLQYRCLALR